jgi:hypothetical protein
MGDLPSLLPIHEISGQTVRRSHLGVANEFALKTCTIFMRIQHGIRLGEKRSLRIGRYMVSIFSSQVT